MRLSNAALPVSRSQRRSRPGVAPAATSLRLAGGPLSGIASGRRSTSAHLQACCMAVSISEARTIERLSKISVVPRAQGVTLSVWRGKWARRPSVGKSGASRMTRMSAASGLILAGLVFMPEAGASSSNCSGLAGCNYDKVVVFQCATSDTGSIRVRSSSATSATGVSVQRGDRCAATVSALLQAGLRMVYGPRVTSSMSEVSITFVFVNGPVDDDGIGDSSDGDDGDRDDDDRDDDDD